MHRYLKIAIGHFMIAITCLYFIGCASKYEIVREEVEVNKVRIENGLKPVWTYK